MKKYRVLLFALLALLLLPTARSWAVSGSVTVATTAGGTSTVPAGQGYLITLVNTGTNVVDCIVDSVPGVTPTGSAAVTSTNYNFQLAASGGTWVSPSITYAPNQLPGFRAMGDEGIVCLAITGSSTVTFYKR